MKRLALALACIACGTARSAAPVVVSLPAAPPASAAAPTPAPRAAPVSVVVTGAPYGGLALWRPFASGRVEPVAFPWASLSIIDSLVVSPNGREVAYVEGGSAFGPLLVRDLASGAKTIVAAHAEKRELLVAAWSPDGRKVLYAARRAGQLRPDCHALGCPGPGPSSYFVFDRDDARTTAVDVPGELAAWLPSGDVIVADDDGALSRVHRGTKTPVAPGASRHDDFSLDVAGHRLLSTGWDETRKRTDVLALDLTTWKESALAPPGPYASYLWPCASPSGKRVAWLASTFEHHVLAEALVVDGKTISAPSRDLVGFTWIDDRALVAHYADRLDVVDANDGTMRGSRATGAHDSMR